MASDSFGRIDLATAYDAPEVETSVASGFSSSHTELGENVTDYFVERDGQKFAGTHLLIDLWGATNLDDQALIEKALTEALDAAEPKAAAAIEAEDFEAAMSALASLRAPLDAFFEKVTVNADDAKLRANRLSLLARFRAATAKVADFSKLEG
mgnify:CR=1 FL=1